MIERRHVVHGMLLGAGLSGAGLSTGCVTEGEAPDTSAEAPASIRGNGYRLVQDWDFQRTVTTQAQLREHFFTRYIYDNGRLDTLNDEWQRYRDNDNHEFERDGLALVARIPQGKSMGSGQIESGMLRSKWSGQYGYFECSMKVPGARGMWPAFWLNPQDKVWPPEIDIVEIVNNGRDTTRNSFHFVHGPNENNAPRASKLNNNKTYLPGFDYQDDFHTFAVEWTAERVTHYVDDVMVVQRDFRWVHKDGKDAGPAHVLLNLAVGGAWPGPPPGPQVFPARLLVKYIRVWQAP